MDGTSVEFLDHPAAPQQGDSVVVSYSHTGTTDSSSCRFKNWQEVDMILHGVTPSAVFTEGACSHRIRAVSAQNWPNTAYTYSSTALVFRPAGRGRFSGYMVDRDFNLGSYSGGGGTIMNARFDPDGPVGSDQSTTSTLRISSFAHYWGNYVIDENGAPSLPDNGEWAGWAFDHLTHLRGTDVAYAFQSRRYRSGLYTKTMAFRTLWNMAGDFPSLIWEEESNWTTDGVWGTRDEVTESYDLGDNYLLERAVPYGTPNDTWRLSQFTGSSLTTLDEMSQDDAWLLLQVWSGPRLMVFSSKSTNTSDHVYHMYSYGPGGLSFIRSDPAPPYDAENPDIRKLYTQSARTNTTDTDWAWQPATGGLGMGGTWVPRKVVVDADYDVVPWRQIQQDELQCPQAPFPGGDGQDPDSAFSWSYLASHVRANGDWQMAASGTSNRSVGVGVRTNRDSAWRIGHRGVDVLTYIEWAFLEFGKDDWDFGMLRNDRNMLYLVNLAKDRP